MEESIVHLLTALADIAVEELLRVEGSTPSGPISIASSYMQLSRKTS